MTQTERRIYLIKELLAEQPKYRNLPVPADAAEQKRLLRSLMNVRFPQAASENFLTAQDEYLREELAQKGVTELSSLTPVSEGIYLWQGDITTLRCDAIVNAANTRLQMGGGVCGAIFQAAGAEELQAACDKLAPIQTGEAVITPGFALPAKYVVHAAGPVYSRWHKKQSWELLRSAYLASLKLAEEHGLESIAFCCISTGEFHFPNREAAQIAVGTVTEALQDMKSVKRVIFNVFQDRDRKIYADLLGGGAAGGAALGL